MIKKGYITGFSGIDEAKMIFNIIDVSIIKEKGVLVDKACDTTAICAFIWAKADNLDDLKKALKTASEKIIIKIASEYNKD